jgi:hypothetical protein
VREGVNLFFIEEFSDSESFGNAAGIIEKILKNLYKFK